MPTSPNKKSNKTKTSSVRRSPRKKKSNDNNSPVVAAVVAGQKDSTLCTAEVIIPPRKTEGRAGGVVSDTSGKPSANNIWTPADSLLVKQAVEKWKKCNWKQCGIISGEELLPCAVTGCKKQIHPTCMECFAEKGFSENWFNYETIGDTTVCSKTCYNKHVLNLRRKPVWSNDGEKGPDDPNTTSEKILLDWLMVEGNYSNKWRGEDSKGRTKKQVAAELASMMNAAKVRVTRDDKQVMNKIAHIEKSFRCAHDWANTETGQGLKENDPRAFDDAVKGKCSFYFDLLEIFGDRASAKPKALSSGNLDTSESEMSEEKSDSSYEFSVPEVILV
jgi:hypothetical protein